MFDEQVIDNAIKGKTFVFIGQKATTGEPHPLTGRMSVFGSYYPFSSKEEAEKFANKFMDDINACFIEVGGWRRLRKYSLGQSVARYKEHLASLDWE